jgi:hypothetical protein
MPQLYAYGTYAALCLHLEQYRNRRALKQLALAAPLKHLLTAQIPQESNAQLVPPSTLDSRYHTFHRHGYVVMQTTARPLHGLAGKKRYLQTDTRGVSCNHSCLILFRMCWMAGDPYHPRAQVVRQSSPIPRYQQGLHSKQAKVRVCPPLFLREGSNSASLEPFMPGRVHPRANS